MKKAFLLLLLLALLATSYKVGMEYEYMKIEKHILQATSLVNIAMPLLERLRQANTECADVTTTEVYKALGLEKVPEREE